MVSAGSYALSALGIAALVLSLGFGAVRIRRRLMPEWEGAPAHLVEAVLAIALLIWLGELLGLFGVLYASTLLIASLLLAAAVAIGIKNLSPAGGVGDGVAPQPGGREAEDSKQPAQGSRPAERRAGQGGAPPPITGPAAGALMTLIAVGVMAVVFAHWGLTTKDALDRGIFNFDSLWYHMPYAVDIAQSHSVTGLHYSETVFVNWFYPQNSELLHAVGVLFTGRDTLSLFVNFGWLAIAFLAAWCIGRPYARGPLSVVATGVILECHTLVVREPGAAKNDLMAAALLLAAIAILVNAWVLHGREGRLAPGWPLAAAGLSVGLAVGTKSTAVAMAAALTIAVIALAPTGRRWAAAGWWALPAFAGAGFWYLRNLIVAGNPLPQATSLGPLSLPHPERLQTGRPDFSVAHYLTDTTVWRHYFGPGLDQAFGSLWPLVVVGAIAGAVMALLWGADRMVRCAGGVALAGFLAYLFTPLSAAGVEGEPVGFGINIRYAIPALLAGAALLPLGLRGLGGALGRSGLLRRGKGAGGRGEGAGGRGEGAGGRGEGAGGLGGGAGEAPRGAQAGRAGGESDVSGGDWVLLGVLLAVMVITNRADAVLRDPNRFFGLLLAGLAVLAPAALLLARRRGAVRGAVIGFAALAIAVAVIGYPIQRDYLRDRFHLGAGIPGMHLDHAYNWARDVRGARIGLAGTTAGFLGYGFFGTDLSNEVSYLGEKGPHGAFNAIPDCRAFREAVNEADLDYLVTAPFLNFVDPDHPVSSPEEAWLRGVKGVEALERSGPVTVWRIHGSLDPNACGPANAPLHRVPETPGV
ncbi:MAG TPA: hypothetical protein VFL89_05575 [Solirubrobacterales bacterium]|nr:hypothetical protein [Solirubrobacterales bacterium]